MKFQINRRFIGLGRDDTHPLILEKKQWELSGREFIDLTETNPTKTGLNYPIEILGHAFQSEYSWVYEANPKGLESARQAILGYYRDRYRGRSLDLRALQDPEKVFLVSGTSEGYSHLLKILTHPGDEVLVPSPGYPLLEYLAKWEFVRTIPYESLDDLESKISSKTKAILVVHPNNPTGKYYNSDEVQILLDIAERWDLAMIVDEVFSDYIYEDYSGEGRDQGILPFFVSDRVLVFTLNGISKIAGLPSWKLGWIHVQAPSAFREMVLDELEWLTDSYLSVNGISQELLPMVLASRHLIQNQIRSRVRRNIEFAWASFQDAETLSGNWSVERPRAGWHLVLSGKPPETVQTHARDTDENWALRLLREEQIFLHPGSFYGYPPKDRKMVLSLIVECEHFRSAIGKIRNWDPTFTG